MDAKHVPAEHGLKRNVKQLDKDRPHVVSDPLLKNVDQKLPVMFAANRPLGHQIACLRVQETIASGLFCPALVCDLQRVPRRSLNDRNELDPPCFEFVPKEPIDLAAMFLVSLVNRAEYVELDL